MAASFARAYFESALAAIGPDIVESAAAGSDEVGSAVGAGFFIANVTFGTGWCIW